MIDTAFTLSAVTIYFTISWFRWADAFFIIFGGTDRASRTSLWSITTIDRLRALFALSREAILSIGTIAWCFAKNRTKAFFPISTDASISSGATWVWATIERIGCFVTLMVIAILSLWTVAMTHWASGLFCNTNVIFADFLRILFDWILTLSCCHIASRCCHDTCT